MPELIVDDKIKPQGKLLEDTISYFDVKKDFVSSESAKKSGVILLTGIVQRANVPNQNLRIYPKWILEREVNKLLPLIKDNQITGECDHPESLTVSFATTSHKMVDLWWVGDDLYGSVQIIKNAEAGKTILALMEEGVKIGISSRAVGDTIPAINTEEFRQYTDCEVVCENLNLITWDLVSNPSTHGAFMVTESLMTEAYIARTNQIIKENVSDYTLSDYDKKLNYFISKYEGIIK